MRIFVYVYSIPKSFCTNKPKSMFTVVKGLQFHRIPIRI